MIAIDHEYPIATAGSLIQEDLCLLEKVKDEHVLTAAVLCFPASWSLADKFLKPLGHIHKPVAEYSDDIAKRVQRMFDLMRPEQPLWRSNMLFYEDPTLFAPHAKALSEATGTTPYIRSERQSLIKLLDTRAVVFSIHTYLVASESLSKAELAALIR